MAPNTVAVKVTVPHPGDGFCDELSVVIVGEPTASAGDEASAPNAIETKPTIATRVTQLLAFICVPVSWLRSLRLSFGRRAEPSYRFRLGSHSKMPPLVVVHWPSFASAL
jgi:hypothetical protein